MIGHATAPANPWVPTSRDHAQALVPVVAYAIPAPFFSRTSPLRHDGSGRIELDDSDRVMVLGGYDG